VFVPAINVLHVMCRDTLSALFDEHRDRNKCLVFDQMDTSFNRDITFSQDAMSALYKRGKTEFNRCVLCKDRQFCMEQTLTFGNAAISQLKLAIKKA